MRGGRGGRGRLGEGGGRGGGRTSVQDRVFWFDINFGASRCVLRGLRGDKWSRSVREKYNDSGVASGTVGSQH